MVKTETYKCQQCGTDVVRNISRGQRPKWCDRCRANVRTSQPCPICSAPVAKRARYCSRKCAQSIRPRKPKVSSKAPVDTRGPLRRAYEDKDHAGVIAAIKSMAVIDTATGCWNWSRRTKGGYPVRQIGSKSVAVHRLALESSLMKPLGTQAAHHTCANSRCVNPGHLQPVTHRENLAEMLARKAYVTRIRELEQALAALAPSHPLLSAVDIA
ncbi:HNH endonuclease [Mycobacteroides abscessus subsp. abscessus]|nr:hypothetical protein PROPHIGD12-2_45 [Mycobacterium phage prophiGD12-2]SLI66484.1 HNH endonuclease [Mycobacteroides abscessus subsp. abscessus]